MLCQYCGLCLHLKVDIAVSKMEVFHTWIGHEVLEWMEDPVIEYIEYVLNKGSTHENNNHVSGKKIDFPMGINLFRQGFNGVNQELMSFVDIVSEDLKWS